MASLMPFGYWPIDVDSGVARPKDEFGKTVDNTIPEKITDFSKDWLLVGCEPPTMFKLDDAPFEICVSIQSSWDQALVEINTLWLGTASQSRRGMPRSGVV